MIFYQFLLIGNLEISVQQTEDRLARAQMLSYSLEEESERWKQSLIDVDKTLKVLVSNLDTLILYVKPALCRKSLPNTKLEYILLYT